MLNNLWNVVEKIIRAVIGGILKIFGKNLTEQQWQAFMQFVKFCIVGISNTAISLAIYYIFVLVNKELYILGNVCGFIVSVLNSYFWNSRFVFKKRDEKGKTLVKTFLAYGTNLLVGTGMLYLLINALKLSEYIAPLINLVVTIPLNFVLNKFWVMKNNS